MVTYATIELDSSEPGCAGIPEGALERMGKDDTLLSIALQPAEEPRARWTRFADLEPVDAVDDACLGTLAERSFVGVWEESGIEIKALGIGHRYEFNLPTTSAPLPQSAMPGGLTSALASLRFHAP